MKFWLLNAAFDEKFSFFSGSVLGLSVLSELNLSDKRLECAFARLNLAQMLNFSAKKGQIQQNSACKQGKFGF